jgi:mono/diheme cytochrome c family protein
MRAAPILFVLWIVGGSAFAQDSTNADEARQGRHLATLLCISCHLVAPDQPYAPTLVPPAPTFQSIAQRKDATARSLTHFLKTTNQGVDNPNGMPNPNLADFQIRAIVSYILSLRHEASAQKSHYSR